MLFTIFIGIISAAFNCMYNLYRPNEATLGHSSGFLGQTWRAEHSRQEPSPAVSPWDIGTTFLSLSFLSKLGKSQ